MKEIKSKITAQKPVKWRSLEWLQNDRLKDIAPEDMAKLKNSLVRNNFIQPFNVWKDSKGKEWILDGRTRKIAMTELEAEGVIIPEKLPANYIDCKNKKEAARLVLIYSSSYAKVNPTGLKEYLDLNNLLINDIEKETEFSGMDLSLLFPDDETEEEGNITEIAKNLKDIYLTIGEYRILVDRDKYEEWIENIKATAGYDKLSISKAILGKLGIK